MSEQASTDLPASGGRISGLRRVLRGILREPLGALGLTLVAVVVLSADNREDVRRQALLQGANRVFVKPVDPVRLLAEIGALAPMRQVRVEVR